MRNKILLVTALGVAGAGFLAGYLTGQNKLYGIIFFGMALLSISFMAFKVKKVWDWLYIALSACFTAIGVLYLVDCFKGSTIILWIISLGLQMMFMIADFIKDLRGKKDGQIKE